LSGIYSAFSFKAQIVIISYTETSLHSIV